MAISFENAFGVHPDALLVRDQRSSLLAENIANADTPGYKARDLDFQSALEGAQARQSGELGRTDPRHFEISTASRRAEAAYRVSNQTDTGDGNSVDIHEERNAFARNAMEYQTSLNFLNSRINGLKKAITGGQQ